MRRGSFIGPILLIVLGVTFLIHNLKPDLPILDMLGRFWPLLLIGWGLIRAVEITVWRMSGKPLPRSGISGGEWFLAILICLLGSGIFYGGRITSAFPFTHVRLRGLEILGESFEYTQEEKKVDAGRTPKLVIEKFAGNARIAGADGEQLRLSGQTRIRAFAREEANTVNSQCPWELLKQGEVWILRTNQDRAHGNSRISAAMEITVPRGATIEARGRSGDFDISNIDGGVTIYSDNAGVRLNRIGGDVSIETRRSDVIRAVEVKGNVDVRGAGWDLELDSVQGNAVVNGEFKGDLLFRRLARPVRFDSSSTELRVEKTNGQVTLSRGDLSASGVTGPIVVKSKSKDVELSSFTGPVEISLSRGDILIRPGAPLTGKLDLRTRAGDIDIGLPESGGFEIKAETRRGEIQNFWGDALGHRVDGRRQTLEGKAGAGPSINAITDRGTVMVRKGNSADVSRPPKSPQPPKPPKGPVEL